MIVKIYVFLNHFWNASKQIKKKSKSFSRRKFIKDFYYPNCVIYAPNMQQMNKNHYGLLSFCQNFFLVIIIIHITRTLFQYKINHILLSAIVITVQSLSDASVLLCLPMYLIIFSRQNRFINHIKHYHHHHHHSVLHIKYNHQDIYDNFCK